MTTQTSSQYEKAMKLAESGQFEQAYDLVQIYLQEHPDDPEALNDTAVLLHCLHRSGEGLDYLERARALAGDTPEIIWNMAEAFLAENRPTEALPLLKRMGGNHTVNTDILNRTAHQLIDLNLLQEAIDLLNWSLEISPDQELLRPMVEVIESKKNEQASAARIEAKGS